MLAPVCSTGTAAGLAGENLQARIRGMILMALSNKCGWLVLTTGNKSEMAVGYATLYGDMAGGYALMKDVPKILVYELCEYAERRGGPRPRSPTRSSPSRRRRSCGPTSGTTGCSRPTSSWTRSSRATSSGTSTVADLVGAGYEEPTVRRVIELVDHARVQAPPGPARCPGHERGFGKDRRMPITSRTARRTRRGPAGPKSAITPGP